MTSDRESDYEEVKRVNDETRPKGEALSTGGTIDH